jgi:hypothetical protein
MIFGDSVLNKHCRSHVQSFQSTCQTHTVDILIVIAFRACYDAVKKRQGARFSLFV